MSEDTPRCRAALTVPIPDEPGLRRQRMVAQCEKPRGHAGKHRAEPTLLWESAVPAPA